MTEKFQGASAEITVKKKKAKKTLRATVPQIL